MFRPLPQPIAPRCEKQPDVDGDTLTPLGVARASRDLARMVENSTPRFRAVNYVVGIDIAQLIPARSRQLTPRGLFDGR